MAMIKCPECDKEAPEAARSCPYCGYPFKRGHLRIVAVSLAVAVVLIVIAAAIAVLVTRSPDFVGGRRGSSYPPVPDNDIDTTKTTHDPGGSIDEAISARIEARKERTAAEEAGAAAHATELYDQAVTLFERGTEYDRLEAFDKAFSSYQSAGDLFAKAEREALRAGDEIAALQIAMESMNSAKANAEKKGAGEYASVRYEEAESKRKEAERESSRSRAAALLFTEAEKLYLLAYQEADIELARIAEAARSSLPKVFADEVLGGDTPDLPEAFTNLSITDLPAAFAGMERLWGNVVEYDFDSDGRLEYAFFRRDRDDLGRTALYIGEIEGDAFRFDSIFDSRSEAFRISRYAFVDVALDVDGDGDVELILDNQEGGTALHASFCVVEFGGGTPKLTDITYVYNAETGEKLRLNYGYRRFGDFNGDGITDFECPVRIAAKGSNADRSFFIEIVNWNGREPVRATKRFREYYASVLLPQWREEAASPGARGENNRKVLEYFEEVFNKQQQEGAKQTQQEVTPSPANEVSMVYAICVLSVRQKDGPERYAEQLRNQGYEASVRRTQSRSGRVVYRTVIGEFADRKAAEEQMRELKSKGKFSDAFVIGLQQSRKADTSEPAFQPAKEGEERVSAPFICTASVDKNVVALGDTIVLTLTASGPAPLPEPELPPFIGFDVLRSLDTTTGTRMVNGARAPSSSYRYVMAPREKGTYVIGSATFRYRGKHYRTARLKIQVE